jgi:AAA domain
MFNSCSAYVVKRALLKGVINRGETSSLVGPPGSGKSAFETEIAVHCALGRDWRGNKAKERCGVLIFALERGDLYRRRLHAYKLRDEIDDLPIAVADSGINILDARSVDRIVATVREVERDFEHKVGLIIIDTYAKAIAAGGGDEDKAKDQNRAAAHLRMIHERLNVHIGLVGHTGKDETKGARGSNAHAGDVDVMMRISGDGPEKTVRVTKANEQEERVLTKFKIEEIVLGNDDDNDPITTGIVSKGHHEPRASSGSKVSPLAFKFFTVLKELIDGDQVESLPNRIRAVSSDAFRAGCEAAGLIDRNKPDSARTMFNKTRRQLIEAKLIGHEDGWNWLP